MEYETNKPLKGSWNNLNSEESERYPKLSFELNKPVIVEFLDDNPKEFPSKMDNDSADSVFYVFDVRVNSENMSFATSSWTLLRGLKNLSPLKGKKAKITLLQEKGRKRYEVEEVIKN